MVIGMVKRTKLKQQTIEILLLMLILLLPFFSNSTIAVTTGVIISALFSWKRGIRIRRKFHYDKQFQHRIQNLTMVIMAFVAILFIVQVFQYNLNRYYALVQLKVILQIYIGVIVITAFYHSSIEIDKIVRAFCYFLIIFSLYYLGYVALHGLPNERSSIFATFSSNYCATSIYLCYPLLLFYWLEIGADKKVKKLIGTALILSLIVVLLSGSRTAFGITALIAIIQYFIMSRKRKNFFKSNATAIVTIVTVLTAYLNIPAVHNLVERALGALGGTTTVNSDIRTVIWSSFINKIWSGNYIIGEATNMVDTFGWLQPAHNFALEILLDVGIIGMGLFVIHSLFSYISLFVMSKGIRRVYLLQILGAFLITAYVQPFFSTSFNCGFIVWISILAIARSSESLFTVKAGVKR